MGVQKELTKAFYWYQKSANHNCAYGQYGLEICYRFGLGTQKDQEKSFYWFQKSVEQGNAQGQVFLGDCYVLGQ